MLFRLFPRRNLPATLVFLQVDLEAHGFHSAEAGVLPDLERSLQGLVVRLPDSLEVLDLTWAINELTDESLMVLGQHLERLTRLNSLALKLTKLNPKSECLLQLAKQLPRQLRSLSLDLSCDVQVSTIQSELLVVGPG